MRFVCSQHTSIFQLSIYQLSQIKALADEISSAHKVWQEELSGRDLCSYADQDFDFGVNVRSISGASIKSKCERLKSSDFWHRQLTKISLKTRETVAVRNLMVGDFQPYCSDETFDFFFARQAARGTVTFKNHQANMQRSANQSYLMAKAAAKKAYESNYLSVFITLVLDHRYHSSSSSYIGKTFEDGYSELSKALKCVLEYLSRFGERGRDFYGVRCVEVHKDGCPHFHVNLFIRSDLLAPLTDKLRAVHYRQSNELGVYFDDNINKVIQVRSKGRLEDYSKSIAYIFKNSYAAKGVDGRKLISALRQKAAIGAYGKHQYELIGMNGKSELIREVSKHRETIQVANDLGFTRHETDRRNTWLKAVGVLIFRSASKYRLVKELVQNKYGDTIKKTVSVVTKKTYRWESIDFYLIALAVICNSSRNRRWMHSWAVKYASILLYSRETIRAPPKQPFLTRSRFTTLEFGSDLAFG